MVFDLRAGLYWRPKEGGLLFVFPRGWTGSWQIHEPIRKLYVLF